jgi:hypothetical protein
MTLLREFWAFLKANKVWWLTPTIILVLVLGLLLLFANGPALSPFLYGH